MKIFILDNQYIIGFANSLKELQEKNNQRSFPYNYNWKNVTSHELTVDIFQTATIEGQSNFKDYVRFGNKNH